MNTSNAIAAKKEDPWEDANDLRWAAKHWAARMNVRVKSVHIRPMRTKWASISTRGRLTLDVGVLELDRELGEYILVHELAHLLAPNHGRVFKSFLSAYLPDWEEREKRLRHLERQNLEGKFSMQATSPTGFKEFSY